MEQISIWDILGAEEKPLSDFPCDTCLYDVKGCCAYSDNKKHCVLGSAHIQRYDISTDDRVNQWEKVQCSKGVWVKGLSVSQTDDGDNWKTPVNIDRVEVGQYEGHKAEIGLRWCVSGYNDEFEIWVAVMWRKLEEKNNGEHKTNNRP